MTTLASLSDTSLTPIANGYLRWDGFGAIVEYQPTIPASVLTGLAAVALSGAYASLSGTPTLPVNGDFSLAGLSDTDPTLTRNNYYLRWNASGTQVVYEQYIDSSVISGLAPVATVGTYASLTGLPTLFSGAYADLTGKPTLFSGAYADLTGKPNLALYATVASQSTVATTGQYTDLLNIPTSFVPAAHTHTYASLTGTPAVPTLLNDLSNVNATPSNNDLLSYNLSSGQWEARTLDSVTDFVDVHDVPLSNGYLRWNTDASKIIYETHIAASKITGLATVATSGNLSDMTDVLMSGVALNDIIVYNGTKWINTPPTPASGVSLLTDLTDVNLVSITPNQILRNVGGLWVNSDENADLQARIEDVATTTYVTTTANAGKVDVVSLNGITLNSGAGTITAVGTITSATNLTFTATNDIIIDSIKWVTADGTAGQALTTNGAGQLGWTTVTTVADFTDLGDVPASYATHAGKIVAVNGTETGLEFIAQVSITGKADKIVPALAGNFAGLDAGGNITDSGKKTADFATAAQGTLAATSLQPGLVDNVSVLINDAGYLTGITAESIADLTDVDITTVAPTDGQVLAWSATKFVPANKEFPFLDLTDVSPSTYVGQAKKVAAVNVAENAIEFVTIESLTAWKAGTASPYTVTSGEKLIVDSSGGTYIILVPDSPSVGYSFKVVDYNANFAANNVEIRNVSLVLKGTLNTNSAMYEIVWTGAVWKIANIG